MRNMRNLSIVAAVLLLSAVVLSAVAAQDATSTEEPSAPDTSAAVQGRPLLGVSLQDSDNGVTVVEVVNGSAAEDAGLQAGDVITAINDTEVTTVDDAKTTIAALSVGDEVTVAITRDGEAMTVTATLGEQSPIQMQPRSSAPGRGNRGMFGGRELGLSYNSEDQTWTITSLSEDSPLYADGLRDGDVITALDGEAVDPASLFQHLQSLDSAATVTLTIERDGESQDIDISVSDLTALAGFGAMRFGLDQLPREFSQMMPMFSFGNGWLGVTFRSIDAQVAEANNLSVTEGALVTEIADGSPAADAGLVVNDVVTAVNGEAVDEEHTLRDRLIAYEPGDTITLTVLRDGESQDIDVTLGEPEMTDLQNMFPNGFSFRGPFGNSPFNLPDRQPTEEAAPNA